MTLASARTPAERASPLLRQRIRAVFKELPKGLAGDEEAIHQMRVAGRRLRAALPQHLDGIVSALVAAGRLLR